MRWITAQLFFMLACILFFSPIFLVYPFSACAQTVYPTPSFVYSPLTPRVGDVVTFDALWWEKYWVENYGNRTFTYSWRFGDNTSAAGPTVSHVYASPGVFLAGVTVVDNFGFGGTSEMYIEVREHTPVTVSVSLSSDSIYTGQEVTIKGDLTYNGKAVSGEWVTLSSKTYIEGATWENIAAVKTNSSGKYSAIWKPRYGVYQINATWQGNSTYLASSTTINLNVQGFGNFIIEFSSNSTISELNYNASTRVLSFFAEGPSGTFGHTKITLEKDPTFNPQTISVFLDDNPINYTINSTDQSWILGISYSHSVHNVKVNFNTEKTSKPTTIPSLAPTPAHATSPTPFASSSVSATPSLSPTTTFPSPPIPEFLVWVILIVFVAAFLVVAFKWRVNTK